MVATSTAERAPATTAAGSSSRAHRPTSSPPAPPSPASTSRPTPATDRATCDVGSSRRDTDGRPGGEEELDEEVDDLVDGCVELAVLPFDDHALDRADERE